jgi:hypothetical protein
MAKFSAVARLLGSTEPWVEAELERCAKIVALPKADGDASIEAELLSCAEYLQRMLPVLYGRAYELVGEEPPEVVENILMNLDDLIPLLESDLILSIDVSKGGPKPDRSKRLCAMVCANIWRKVHDKVQPYSRDLQDACAVYWCACDHEEDDRTDWERYLSQAVAPLTQA